MPSKNKAKLFGIEIYQKKLVVYLELLKHTQASLISSYKDIWFVRTLRYNSEVTQRETLWGVNFG